MAKLRNFNLPLRSISLSIKDIEKIYERLNALVEGVGARETAAWTPADNETQQAFEIRRQNFRTSAYRVHISIKGSGDAKGNYGAEIEGWPAAGFTDTELRCFDGTGGFKWKEGSSAASSSLRL